MATYIPYRWSGSEAMFLDAPNISQHAHVTVGCYGGNTASGAKKNEDAALLWVAADGSWTFAALLDAHGSSDSANLVLERLAEMEDDTIGFLADEPQTPLGELSARVARHLGDESFRQECARIRGETALLLCAQRGEYLWWLSVGDIPVYVFHSEFARLGQYALNQRMFYEWIGQVNTFALPVPCYATGTRQLRSGQNRILLTTDGLLECGTRPFEDAGTLHDLFTASPITEAAQTALERVHTEQGRDSATLITWEVNLPESEYAMRPSA